MAPRDWESDVTRQAWTRYNSTSPMLWLVVALAANSITLIVTLAINGAVANHSDNDYDMGLVSRRLSMPKHS